VHRREPARTGSSEKSKQERLGLIVARMPQGDHVGLELIASPDEEFVTRISTGVFNGFPLTAGTRADVVALDEERITESVRTRSAKTLVAVGILPELMIEMRDAGDRQLSGSMQVVQQVQERDRVAAARHGDDNTRRRGRQVVTPDSAPDGI
jgi:hypothetical protein